MTQKRSHEPDNDLPDGLSKPARRALTGAGFHRLEQLTSVSGAEIAALHGVGPKGVKLLRHALAGRGLSFADDA